MDTKRITRYWLPIPEPVLDSIAVDGDDVWFYMREYGAGGIGRINLKEMPHTFCRYLLGNPWYDREYREKMWEPETTGQDHPSMGSPTRREAEPYTFIGQAVAARAGSVWFGEATEGPEIPKVKIGSQTIGGRSMLQALCRMNAGSDEVTRYSFALPERRPTHPFRLDIDSPGRMIGGATGATDVVWFFDNVDLSLKWLKLEKEMDGTYTGIDSSGHSSRNTSGLRDIAIESDGKHGWFIEQRRAWDSFGALYRFNISEESLLKYPLYTVYEHMLRRFGLHIGSLHPMAIALGPDGKVWFTSQSSEPHGSTAGSGSSTSNPVSASSAGLTAAYPVDRGYVLSLDPKKNLLTAYKPLPKRPFRLGGILVTSDGNVWIGYSSTYEWGIVELAPDRVPSDAFTLTPIEQRDFTLLELQVTEVSREEARCRSMELSREEPVTLENREDYTVHLLGEATAQVKDLAQDSTGQIWFTTWNKGYVGVLTASE